MPVEPPQPTTGPVQAYSDETEFPNPNVAKVAGVKVTTSLIVVEVS